MKAYGLDRIIYLYFHFSRARGCFVDRSSIPRPVRISALVILFLFVLLPLFFGTVTFILPQDSQVDRLDPTSTATAEVETRDMIRDQESGRDGYNLTKAHYYTERTYQFEAVSQSGEYPGCRYFWYFGDGTEIQEGIWVEHSWSVADRYEIILWVVDEFGDVVLQDSANIDIENSMSTLAFEICFSACMVFPLGCFIFIVIICSLILAVIINAIIKPKKKKKEEKMEDTPPQQKVKWQSVALFITLLLTINGFWMASMGLYLITDDIGDICWPFFLAPFNICCGVIGWITFAYIGVWAWYAVLATMRNAPYFKKFKNNFILIKKDEPIKGKMKKGKRKMKISSHINFALETALTGSFVAFFLITLTFHQVDSLDELMSMAVRESNLIRALILFPPLISFIIVPFQTLLDSNLLFVNKDDKRGIVVIYLGSRFKEILQGVLGVSAVVGFVMMFMTLNDEIHFKVIACIAFMFTIFTLTFPVVFGVAFVYSFTHNFMVRQMNKRWDAMKVKEFHIRESKEYAHHMCIEPMEVKEKRLKDPDYRPFAKSDQEEQETLSTTLIPGPPPPPDDEACKVDDKKSPPPPDGKTPPSPDKAKSPPPPDKAKAPPKPDEKKPPTPEKAKSPPPPPPKPEAK